MIIKLIPSQVPQVWSAIKYAAAHADRVDQSYMQEYMNDLLYSLLSDKVQCFVKLDDNRTLMALALTSIMIDKITQEKSLDILCLYSFQATTINAWANDFQTLRKFAEKSGCKKIVTRSASEQVFKIVDFIGLDEISRTFSMEI